MRAPLEAKGPQEQWEQPVQAVLVEFKALPERKVQLVQQEHQGPRVQSEHLGSMVHQAHLVPWAPQEILVILVP